MKTVYRIVFAKGPYEYWEYKTRSEAREWARKALKDYKNTGSKLTLKMVKVTETVLGKMKNY